MSKSDCLFLLAMLLLVIELKPKIATADPKCIPNPFSWMNTLNGVIKSFLKIYDMSNANTDITRIEKKLDALNSEINNLHSKLRYNIEAVPYPNTVGNTLNLNRQLTYLEFLFGWYERQSKGFMKYTNYTLLEFVDVVTNFEAKGLRECLTQIHGLLTSKSSNEPGLLESITDQLKTVDFNVHCKLNQSPREYLQNYYFFIATYQTKGLVMQIFAYTVLTLFKKGNFTNEVEYIRENFKNTINQEIKLLRTLLQNLSQEVWRCDPVRHVEGETYEELTELLQGFLINESDIDEKGSCKHKCSTLAKPMKTNHCGDKLCQNQRNCAGSIYSCKMLSKDPIKVEVGATKSGNRYSSITFGNTVYGNGGYVSSVVKIQNWISKHHSCDYCWCVCDEQGLHSDRYFNLRPTITDTENNRVVTGLRFVKKNRIIHLQIQEGELLPGGVINNSTVRWIPVDDYKLDDTNVTNGQDYYTLDYHHRSIALDDVRTKRGQVVIGVKLIKTKDGLLISVLGRGFNIYTGNLNSIPNKEKWRYNRVRRTTLPGGDLQRSININSSSHPSESSTWIRFSVSNLQKELRQFTVPNLDAQPVVSAIPVPLEGVGLYHKGQVDEGYAGFVAPKLLTYDPSFIIKC